MVISWIFICVIHIAIRVAVGILLNPEKGPLDPCSALLIIIINLAMGYCGNSRIIYSHEIWIEASFIVPSANERGNVLIELSEGNQRRTAEVRLWGHNIARC